MKTHIRRWVNEGHDVTTAEEMKVALESHGGVRGCRFAVVEINKTKMNAEVCKIPGISFLNNFHFYEDGVRSWKAYQIGKGHFYSYASVVTRAQEDTGLKVLVPFSSQPGCLGEIAVHSSAKSHKADGLFSCVEQGCVKMFSTFDNLQQHLDAERHVFMEEQDTAYDVIKKKWASILSSVSLQKQGSVPPVKKLCEGTAAFGENKQTVKGQALKTITRSSRMTENVKSYLTQMFNRGAKEGNKADAKQVEHDMKHARDARGEFLFQPNEWRTSKQIANFFSNLSKSQRKAGVEAGGSIPECHESDGEEPIYEDVNLKALQRLVENELQTDLDHPIMFLEHNLCRLGKQGKLQELRLNVLKKACMEFKVDVKGPKTRKDSFAGPLQEFLLIQRSKGCKYCHNV